MLPRCRQGGRGKGGDKDNCFLIVHTCYIPSPQRVPCPEHPWAHHSGSHNPACRWGMPYMHRTATACSATVLLSRLTLFPTPSPQLARETTVGVTTYTLPDGHRLRLGAERFMAPEVLFDPQVMGLEAPGLAQLAHDAIQVDAGSCRVAARALLSQSCPIFAASSSPESKLPPAHQHVPAPTTSSLARLLTSIVGGLCTSEWCSLAAARSSPAARPGWPRMSGRCMPAWRA